MVAGRGKVMLGIFDLGENCKAIRIVLGWKHRQRDIGGLGGQLEVSQAASFPQSLQIVTRELVVRDVIFRISLDPTFKEPDRRLCGSGVCSKSTRRCSRNRRVVESRFTPY